MPEPMMTISNNFGRSQESGLPFTEQIRILIKQLPCKVYLDFNWKHSPNRKFAVVGATQVSNMNRLRESLLAGGFTVTDVDTFNYRGLYCEASPGQTGLFATPKRQSSGNVGNSISQTADEEVIFEVKAFGRENHLEDLAFIDYQSFLSLCGCMERVIAEDSGIPYPELLFCKYENSHRLYRGNYLEFKNNQKTLQYDPGQCKNIIEIFSWIYCWEIRMMADFIHHQSVSIHDVGASVAQFPLLLSTLAVPEMFGLDIQTIIASDYGWTGEKYVKQITGRNDNYRPIRFLKLDITNSGEMDRLPVTDVVIINDVLEHLPDNETAFAALTALWNKAGSLLIAHVPIESTPNPAWDHYITFHEHKIWDWAGRLPGGRLLSDNYYHQQQTLTALGFMAVGRPDRTIVETGRQP